MLILKERHMFDDNWIYIHDPSVQVGRIQNFRSWSPEMVPDPDKACYGLEYFCFEHDGLWDSSDADLIELAKKELMQIGLAQEGDVMDGCVVRQKKAYPVYDDDYAEHVATIRDEIEERYPNLHLVGRNGMHKYNNQDHAMMTAMLCVENILADTKLYDLWQVNGDAEYHEAGKAAAEKRGTALRHVPTRVTGTPIGLGTDVAGDASLACHPEPRRRRGTSQSFAAACASDRHDAASRGEASTARSLAVCAARDDSIASSPLLRERFHRRTGAHEIAVAVNAVDARDGRPEFVFARPRRRIGRLFPRIGPVPFIRDNLLRGVRRIFQHVVLPIGLARCDRLDLAVNGNHRFAKTIDLRFRFALGRLDHHRSGHRE